MTRQETIDKAWNMMLELKENYTWEKYHELMDLISDWNSEHYEGAGEDAEIFMCEERDCNSIRMYLEDDYIDIEC